MWCLLPEEQNCNFNKLSTLWNVSAFVFFIETLSVFINFFSVSENHSSVMYQHIIGVLIRLSIVFKFFIQVRVVGNLKQQSLLQKHWVWNRNTVHQSVTMRRTPRGSLVEPVHLAWFWRWVEICEPAGNPHEHEGNVWNSRQRRGFWAYPGALALQGANTTYCTDGPSLANCRNDNFMLIFGWWSSSCLHLEKNK